MQQRDIIQWLYENRIIKEMYQIELSPSVMLMHEPYCIGMKREDIILLQESEYAFTLITLHGVVTLWKNAQITHVTLC